MSNIKSTGPKSLAGKEIASINAFKHGLTAQKWISPELEKYFEQVLKSLTQEYLPQTPTEIILVERVATTMTKARRLNNIEDAQFQLSRRLVAQDLVGGIAPHRKDMLRLTRENAAINEGIIKLHEAASIPTIEVMNIINRQQNSLSRQLSKELSELITVIRLRENLEQANKPEGTGDQED